MIIEEIASLLPGDVIKLRLYDVADELAGGDPRAVEEALAVLRDLAREHHCEVFYGPNHTVKVARLPLIDE
jgi:hypothetical protein